jgi:hypothetical protein
MDDPNPNKHKEELGHLHHERNVNEEITSNTARIESNNQKGIQKFFLDNASCLIINQFNGLICLSL